MTTPDIRIQLLSRPKLLKPIRELLRSYVAGSGFTDEQAQNVVLAVDEACTNAIRHSYGGSCDEVLELDLFSGENGIEIVLADHGAPVPPECLDLKNTLPPDPDTVRPGGLGVRLICTVFDAVEFFPGKERGNRVVMRLRRQSAET